MLALEFSEFDEWTDDDGGVLHFLYADASYRYLVPAMFVRTPVVCHWSGSDVIRVLGERGLRGTLLQVL